MDCLYIRQPFVNFETVAVSRLVHLCFTYIHRIDGVFQSKPSMDYSSLFHYRSAASLRSTYYNTLLKCYHHFRSELHHGEARGNSTSSRESTFATPPRRSSRIRVNGIVPDNIPNFASAKTFSTPKQNILKQLNSAEAHSVVVERRNTCPGYMVERKICKKMAIIRGHLDT